jgi:hypothetical protein
MLRGAPSLAGDCGAFNCSFTPTCVGRYIRLVLRVGGPLDLLFLPFDEPLQIAAGEHLPTTTARAYEWQSVRDPAPYNADRHSYDLGGPRHVNQQRLGGTHARVRPHEEPDLR